MSTSPTDTSRTNTGSARSLLLTLLGEFLYPSPRPVQTATLLYTLAGVGIAEKAGRQAIVRAAAVDWMRGEKQGRRTAWQLSERGQELIAEGSAKVRHLGAEATAWDGMWTVLYVTLPESRRIDRIKLYRALGWIGFGNPIPGIWICPDATRANQARRAIEARQLGEHTLAMSSRMLDFGVPVATLVRQAWDLDAIASHYKALIERFSARRPRGSDEQLFTYIELVNAIQRLPEVDPRLPRSLLPPRWDSSRAVGRLMALREKWRGPAHERWAELLAVASE